MFLDEFVYKYLVSGFYGVKTDRVDPIDLDEEPVEKKFMHTKFPCFHSGDSWALCAAMFVHSILYSDIVPRLEHHGKSDFWDDDTDHPLELFGADIAYFLKASKDQQRLDLVIDLCNKLISEYKVYRKSSDKFLKDTFETYLGFIHSNDPYGTKDSVKRGDVYEN